ncbi:MAG: sugar phosphate nucleotidyltransferase [Pseudomonadota bacterium]
MPKTLIVPLGGRGTRLFPLTKSVPKGLLPLGRKPVLQYVLDEAIAAEFRHFVFVLGADGALYRDYLVSDSWLANRLRSEGRRDELRRLLDSHLRPARCTFVEQPAPEGLGDAVLRAAPHVAEPWFGLVIPDTVVTGGNAMAMAVAAARKTALAVLTLAETPRERLSDYGIAALGAATGSGRLIRDIVEKPSPDLAPSTLHFNGRAILPVEIFAVLTRLPRPTAGELHLTDALAELAGRKMLLGVETCGQSFDCGSFRGLAEASCHMARPLFKELPA